MDIFSKIDEQTQQQQESKEQPQETKEQQECFGNIIEDENGRYGYKFVLDQSKQDTDFSFCRLPMGYSESGFFARQRAKRFYKFLLKPIKDTKTQKQYERQLKKRAKKIERFLKKGINFTAFFTSGMIRIVLETLTTDELKMLYNHGFDIYKNIACLYSENKVFSKNIYYAIDYFPLQVLKSIPTHMLEKIIHTRGGVYIRDQVVSSLVSACYYYPNLNLARNIQLLIKTGQITLSAQDVFKVCAGLSNNGFYISPELAALRDYANAKTPQDSGNGDEKKYSSQKHIESKTEKGKTRAQEEIDKLFEDAQNAIDE